MAEWSKALVLGTSLSGGAGSNPSPVIIFIFLYLLSRFYYIVAPRLFLFVAASGGAGNTKTLIWTRSRPMSKISMLPNPIVDSRFALVHYWIWKHTNFRHWTRPRPISVY